MSSASIVVVMVEPRIPQNVGNVARLCACVGADFYLVGDLGFDLNDKYLQRAGMDYLDRVAPVHVSDMDEVFEKFPDAVPFYYSTKAEQSIWDVSYPDQVLLVFGREDKGLPDWVMKDHPEQSVTMPMPGVGRSLNVANSVAIGVYEVLRQKMS